jgi:mRNA-degrading endonuclease toxin of MazEF toxin-antitoxin module
MTFSNRKAALQRPQKTGQQSLLYIPHKGDIVRFDHAPAVSERYGNEIIDKDRPWIVISKSDFNKETFMLRACPVTSRRPENCWELQIDRPIRLESGKSVIGTISVCQCRNIGWHMDHGRGARKLCKCPTDLLARIIAIDNQICSD